MSNSIDNACSVIQAVLTPIDEVSPDQIRDILAILHGEKRAVNSTDSTPLESPMSCGEVAKLLRVSKQTVHYHAQRGRIRKVFVKGSKRARGFLASDVRAILQGRAK